MSMVMLALTRGRPNLELHVKKPLNELFMRAVIPLVFWQNEEDIVIARALEMSTFFAWTKVWFWTKGMGFIFMVKVKAVPAAIATTKKKIIALLDDIA